jgi:hypothetical protein
MSESWRIKTIYDDRSQRVLPSAGAGLGATVVRSSRGIEHPVYFGKGETQKILSLFGVPSSDNPELLEAIEYNKHYPMYLVSPTNLGLNGGILIGDAGSVTLGAGISGVEGKDLSSLTLTAPLTNVSTNAYAGIASHLEHLLLTGETPAPTLKVLIDGVDAELTFTESEGVYTIAGTGLIEGNLVADTGVISLLFDTALAPEPDAVLEFAYDVDFSSDYYCMLTNVGPSDSDYIRVKVSGVEINGRDAFEMQVEMKNIKGEYKETTFSPITFSLFEDHEDGFGQNIYIENVFENSDYFVPHVEGALEFTNLDSFVDDSSFVILSGGTRGGVVSGADLVAGYSFFQESRKYPIDLFFDATVDSAIPAEFATLRASYNKYARYILPIGNMTPTALLALETSPITARDRGISYYWGWFKIRNNYHSSGKLIGIPMGEVAKKHADIMVNAFGGLAPAWYDENGMGGQLTGGRIIESLYDPTEDQLKLMDEMQINPIVLDPSAGPMITSRRTSVSTLSDWSFIDYSGAMDYIIKNVITQVLPYQIVKLNDDNHRTIVRSKTESIIQPMTLAPVNVVDSYFVKCDGENNNDEVKAREEFRLDLAVKFTPRSRMIVFTFINTPQGADVEAMFN